MAYIFNIPAAPDQLSVSQGQIQNNFIALGAIAGKGTVQSNSLNINAGFDFVYLPNQPLSPPITFPVNEVGLYSFLNSNSGEFDLYVNHSVNTGVVQTPITASVLGNNTPAANTSGWTYLPSGILMKWAYQPTGGTGTNPFNFNTGGPLGPNFTQIVNAQVTATAVAINVRAAITAPSVVTFSAGTGGMPININCYLFAIGY